MFVLLLIGSVEAVISNPHAFPSLIAAVNNLLLAVFVYRKNPKSKINRNFALMSFSLGIFNIDYSVFI